MQKNTFLLPPSSIHYLDSGHHVAVLQDLDQNIMDLSRRIAQNGDTPKIQAVQIDGNYFTLNNSQLELCRRLERDGNCGKVRVDLVKLSDVPVDVLKMMVLPSLKVCPQSSTPVAADSGKSPRPALSTDNLNSPHPGQPGEDLEDNQLTEQQPPGSGGPGRTTGRGYQRLDQCDPHEKEDSDDSDNIEVTSSDNSDFEDTDSECDWSGDDDDTSEAGSSDGSEHSTEDERECLL